MHKVERGYVADDVPSCLFRGGGLQICYRICSYLCIHLITLQAEALTARRTDCPPGPLLHIQMKLLIVEDERELSDNIVSYLSSENYVCEQAFSYEEAGMKTGLYDYDCVVLDLMLPGGNGLDLLRELRRRRNPVGVIIVSAKDSLDDKIKGLELGADDYLSKPFHLAELSMRIYALIRRKEFAANNTLWSNGI